ncbi:hypothetical protein QJQ45_030446 [Haematococcus lacustris]|nr:hypothetical protein QJQ45_030446 [Haematococcus lacustris]
MASSSIGPENTRGVVLLIGAPGVRKTCLGKAMVAQQAAKGGSGGAPLFFSVSERLRDEGMLAKHVAPDERAAWAETMRATARDLLSRQLRTLGQRVLVLEAVKDMEGADDLAELLEQHDVPLLQVGKSSLPRLPDSEADTGAGRLGWLLELYSSLGCLAEVSLLDMEDGATQQPSLAALGYAAPAPACSWLEAAGWAPRGRWKKSSSDTSSGSNWSGISDISLQQTWPDLAITPLQPVTSCRLVSCSRARAAVVAEAEAFTGLHPLPLPVPSRSVTCSADARWLAYPGRYLAALKADGVRHLLITTATGQPFLLNRAGALYAYPMQTAPSQPAAATGQEGALSGRAELEGEEQEGQQAASAGQIALEEQLQQLSLHSSRAAEGQVAPARACDVVALPPAAPPPCGLPCRTVLDGELVLHGGGAQPLFLVFDALCVAGSPVWQLPLTARLQHLDSLGLTTASEAVTGQAAASVFTPLPALKVSVAVPLPAATAGVPPPGFVKQQQGPPTGQDTVLVLRKPCFPVSPSGLLQLQAAAKHCGFPADGVVFSPCAMSCVLGQAELLIKWQPPGCVGVDVLGRLANSPPQPSLMTIDDNIHLQRLWGPGAPDALVRDYMHRQVEVEKVSVNFGATYYHNYHDTQRPGKQQGPAPQPPTITKLEGIAWIMRCLCFDKVMGKSLEALERLTYRICLPWSDLVRAVEHQQQQQQQQTARPPSALHSPTLQSSPVPPNPDLVPAALTSPHPARLLPFSQLYALALAAVQCGSVEVSSDPDTGLQVFNYLAAASPGSSQAEQLCRGLVLHPDSQTLVATPFPRFAAERQLDSPPCTVTRAAATAVAPPPPAGQPSSPAAAAVRAAVKVDGSLIIAFLWQGQVHACTRRRMTSEQAVWAQGQLRANPAFVAHAQPGWTYLFEAVYAANTHIISYPFQGLVLLDAICPAGLGLTSGAAKHAQAARLGTLAAPELQLQQAEELGSWLQADRASSSSTSSFAVLLSPSTPRPTPSQPLASDGWVVTLGSSGQRSKLVHANFKHAHYEAQLLHPLCVWDRVRQGASRDQLLPPWLPGHLRAEAEAVLAALHRSFDEVRLQHAAKQQAVAAKQHGGREEQPLSMYYSKVQVSLPEGSATPHLRAQLLDLVRPAHDGSGLPGYQPSPAMAQTFAKSWPKGPLAGRLAPSPEPACTAIQRPQFFELVLAALGGISALRVKSVCWTWCRLVRGWPGLVAAVEKSKQTSAKQCDDGSSADYDDGYYDFRSEWNAQLTAAMADLPPLQWAGDVLRNGIGSGRATAGGSAGRDALSSEALAEAFRHVKQVVGDARRDAYLYDLLAGTRREETSQPYFSGPATPIWIEGKAWMLRSVRFDKVVGNSPEAVMRLTQQICLPWSDLVLAVQQQQQQTAPPPSALHSPTLQFSSVPPNPDTVPTISTSPHPARLLPFSQLHALALAAVQCGSVEVSNDPDTGLHVFNYLAAASPGSSQAEQLCRGLVLHPDSHTLVATPFPRFAAEQQLDSPHVPSSVPREAATALAPPPAGQPSSVRAAVKVDGSLVIAFLWQGQVHACTRHCLTSEQAVWAQGQLRANPDFVAHVQPGWTYLFEAVYAANTHVISYPFQGLVLLDAICPAGLGLASGAAKHALATRLGTLAAPELQLQETEELGSWLQAGQASSPSTPTPIPPPTPTYPPASEGWVVTLGSCGQRIKLVNDSFKRAHYEAQLLHPLCVWDRVRQGASRDQLLPPCLPSHLRAEAEAVLAALHHSFQEVWLHHRAKQQAVAAQEHGGLGEQPLSMYYSKQRDFLSEVVTTPHLRAQLLGFVRPALDGSGLPGYQPSPAMAQTPGQRGR